MNGATRRASRLTGVALLVLCVAAPASARAQRDGSATAGVRQRVPAAAPTASPPGEEDAQASAPARPTIASPLLASRSSLADSSSGWRRARWAPLASAALPGAGQAMLYQDRFLPYLALEAYALLKYASDSREGARQRSAYRRLARTVARAQFSTNTPNGNWEYYERMEHYAESGVYDVVPGGKLQPEPDTTTFNGSVWLLARETYWEDPNVAPDPSGAAYASAIAFYSQRAVTPNYRWSWRDAQLEQDLFRRTIGRSNDYYRQAAQDLGVVIANHVLSTVDSYVTVRLRNRRGGAGGRGGVGQGRGPGAPPPPDDQGYDLSFSIPLPRR